MNNCEFNLLSFSTRRVCLVEVKSSISRCLCWCPGFTRRTHMLRMPCSATANLPPGSEGKSRNTIFKSLKNPFLDFYWKTTTRRWGVKCARGSIECVWGPPATGGTGSPASNPYSPSCSSSSRTPSSRSPTGGSPSISLRFLLTNWEKSRSGTRYVLNNEGFKIFNFGNSDDYVCV